MKNIFFLFEVLFLFFISCHPTNKNKETGKSIQQNKVVGTSEIQPKKDSIGELEKMFIDNGLIDISTIDSTIHVDLRYASTNNFLKINLYGNLKKCYLQKESALKLSAAQKYLKEINSDYSLIVFDGARPKFVQQIMWDQVKLPFEKKIQFLSNPVSGSVHNYGSAVDLSIIDLKKNKELDMGTSFDFIGELAYPILEKKFLKEKKINIQQVENRTLLRKVMIHAGFTNLETEWWHFNACSRLKAQQLYAMLDIPSKSSVIKAKQDNLKNIKIVFKIQLSASHQPVALNSEIFKGMVVEMYQQEGLYKFTTGTAQDLSSAYILRDKIRATTLFKDAFVVAFNNNQRIGIQDAIEMMQ